MKKNLLALLAASSLMLAPIASPQQAALAQRVVDVSPDVNSQNVPPDTSISGQFDTNSTPAVDLNSVQILVNGQDVTNRSTVTRNFFSYRPAQPLPPGQSRVQIDYRNVNGEQRSVNWGFTVQQPQAAVQISSVTHNAASNQLGPGTTFLATINGTPGSQASVLLIQDGRTVREIQAQEVSSGVYVATLNVQSSDRLNEGIVVGRLRRQNQTTFAAASQPVVFNPNAGGTAVVPDSSGAGSTGSGNTGNTASQLQPSFTSHRNGGEVSGSGFTLVGQTRPNATVDVQVTSRVSVLGVVNLGGETLLDEEVTADQNGRFEVEVPGPRIPVPGTRYTVRATANLNNETSRATEITLTQD
ncbi:MAG: hypothetical protein HC840_08400 [Leptolyngbyaceae cyanobacterium RM2_2_4]|nr:hypothetical protein [Leptolyngbyaceae cyanobacterium SM1_4_3]NJO49453.1 hypothetical protein [Leptolyngbyaceae cyanobacterium RM2_2_4]